MENKRAALLALAVAAAVVIATGAAYAAGRQAGPTANYIPSQTPRYGMGPSMMGGYGRYSGMMGSHWMTGNVNGTSFMYQYMRQYWNSTSAP